MSYSVGQLHQYSVELYKKLEAETGQAVGLHPTGNLRLATNRDREGRPFVSLVEGKSYPVYAMQAHPEKNVFEWTTGE